jgi:peptide/nickel transport system substrate-binding protein
MDPDVQNNRMEARKIMEKLGYGSDKHLKIKVATRNIPVYARKGFRAKLYRILQS